MKNTNWLDSKSACALMGIKPQTLYAYVSRRQIRVRTDTSDARRSLYSQSDIDRLVEQNQRPRARSDVAQAAIRWGDPVLTTGISEVRDGTLWLRGQPVEHCADHLSLEETGALLCGVTKMATPNVSCPMEEGPVFSRAMLCLSRQTAYASSMPGTDKETLTAFGGILLSAVTNVCLDMPMDGAVHSRLAAAWDLDAKGQDVVRRALVVMSDHELNASTFAVRISASTGASLPAALLAGMSALSGPRHGNAAKLSSAAIHAQLSGKSQSFLEAHCSKPPVAYGFGHPLYPDGDPRAVHLLSQLPEDCCEVRAINALSQQIGHPPNIDAALSAIASYYDMPVDAPQMLFALGRIVGWTAHAIEQSHRDEIIRPRARYDASLG